MDRVIGLDELFSDTSLYFCKLRVDKGDIPDRNNLADILQANASEPLPPWFTELIAAALRGTLQHKRGRKAINQSGSYVEMVRNLWAPILYRKYLTWLQKRTRTHGLAGWAFIERADWWQGPPHERAARMLQKRMFPHVSWRTVQNRFSSRH